LTSFFSKAWNEWNKGPPIPYVEKELLSKISNGLVLDLGCGTCRGMARFQKYGWEAVGIDITIPPNRLNGVGDVIKGSGLFLPFREEVFDAIIIAQTLHHVSHPYYVLQEAKRCIKKTGYVLIGENVEDNVLLRLARWLYPTHDGLTKRSDYFRLRKVTVRNMILKAGFKILSEKTGIVTWIFWYEIASRLPILRPLSFLVKKIDEALEKLLTNQHVQYYCICSKSQYG
jgi:SAM-dependent methyltransferase